MYTTDNDQHHAHPSETPESERDIWEEIIAAGATMDTFLRYRPVPRETTLELPSVQARLDAAFIPPLPWPLFCVLSTLPGKACVIYLVLWRRAHMAKNPSVTLSSMCLGALGLSRDQKRLGLAALETAGLVTVARIHGKNPQVTVNQKR